MNPRKFGPYFWGALHTACLDGSVCPLALREFVYLYPVVLPCQNCRESFRAILEQYPMPVTNDRAILFRWSVEIHNMVNFKIGKPRMGLAEAQRIWTEDPPETFYDFF